MEALKKAINENSIDGELTEKRLATCDYIFIPLYPEAVVEYVEKNASVFKEGAVVIDCAGVKRSVCDKCFKIAEMHNFSFVGGVNLPSGIVQTFLPVLSRAVTLMSGRSMAKGKAGRPAPLPTSRRSAPATRMTQPNSGCCSTPTSFTQLRPMGLGR